MSRLRFKTVTTVVSSAAAVVAIYSGSACRPIKIDKSNKSASVTCGENSLSVGDTCIKDGFIYLLQDAVAGKAEPSAGKTMITFGKQSLVKGDKLFASARLGYAKGIAATKATATFQVGEVNVGSSLSQFLGDADSASMLRHTVSHQVTESIESMVSLAVSPVSTAPATVDATLLIFRQTQLAYALDAKVQKPGVAPYFAADILDSDKLKSADLGIAASPIDLVAVDSKNFRANDILLIRAGSAWSVPEGKGSACEGAAVTWSLTVDQKESVLDGPHVVSSNRPLGALSVQTIVKIPSDSSAGQISLAAKITPGTGADRTKCVLKIAEPTTLSVMVFRPLSELAGEIKTARYLHDLGSVSADSTKIASHPSGPPIDTLLSFTWDHVRGDALLTDTQANLAAEDRIQPSKAFLQLSRAPDGLSSHVSKTMLMDPDKPRAVTITDVAIEQDLGTQTRFYLTGMAYNNDSKSVLINDAKIIFMHFRRIGDRL